MFLFVTGGSGFIGRSVIRELLAADHTILALVRTETSAQKIRDALPADAEKNIIFVRGTTYDDELLAKAASQVDGVIHMSYNHDFSVSRITANEEDEEALKAMIKGLEQGPSRAGGKLLMSFSGTPFPHAGIPGEPTNIPTGEGDHVEETPFAAARQGARDLVRSLTGPAIRGIDFRVPPVVHGEGGTGFIAVLVALAKAHKAAAYIGRGENRWPSTHKDDVARLVPLSLNVPGGTIIHAAAEAGVPYRVVAEAIAEKLELKTESISLDEAGERLGIMAALVGGDGPVEMTVAKKLGWVPREVGLAQDIKGAAYAELFREH